MQLRCSSENKDGQQCGFPAGHYGRCGNGPQVATWENPYVVLAEVQIGGAFLDPISPIPKAGEKSIWL